MRAQAHDVTRRPHVIAAALLLVACLVLVIAVAGASSPDPFDPGDDLGWVADDDVTVRNSPSLPPRVSSVVTIEARRRTPSTPPFRSLIAFAPKTSPPG